MSPCAIHRPGDRLALTHAWVGDFIDERYVAPLQPSRALFRSNRRTRLQPRRHQGQGPLCRVGTSRQRSPAFPTRACLPYMKRCRLRAWMFGYRDDSTSGPVRRAVGARDPPRARIDAGLGAPRRLADGRVVTNFRPGSAASCSRWPPPLIDLVYPLVGDFDGVDGENYRNRQR